MTHLKHLGVNMISVSPVFETANEEPLYGQDVVDFRKVKGTYGSLQDMKDLIEVGKQDGIKIYSMIACICFLILLFSIPNNSRCQNYS